jgi:DNA-binding response OmpR family regulator
VNKAQIGVLIIEDETIPAHYLQGIVEELDGFEVTGIVPDAKNTLEAIEQRRPDIVFMDIMLKDSMSGAELAVRISDKYPDILIIFMTAYSTDEMVEYATEAKAFAYLLKPYRPREILATLKLAASRLRRPLMSTEEQCDELDLVDGYRYHPQTRSLRYHNHVVTLSSKETQLVDLLCRYVDQVVDKVQIKDKLEISNDSLRSLVYRIRKTTSGKLIASEKRYGYRIVKN